jgi:hypothetical protein
MVRLITFRLKLRSEIGEDHPAVTASIWAGVRGLGPAVADDGITAMATLSHKPQTIQRLIPVTPSLVCPTEAKLVAYGRRHLPVNVSDIEQYLDANAKACGQAGTGC